jgi:drug/metabolite transporter (DMT)-like permease
LARNIPALSGRGETWLGSALVLLAAVGFSAKAIMVKLAYAEPVDAVTLLALRMAFAFPFFLGFAFWSGRTHLGVPLNRADWAVVVVLGLLGYYISSLLDFWGLQYISAGLERLILFLYPTLVLILSALVLRRPVRRREWVALTVAYLGIALVFRHDLAFDRDGMALGATLVFGSAISYALYLMGSGHVIARLGTLRFTAYAMVIACLACMLQFVVTRPLPTLYLPPRVYSLTAAMAIFSTVMPAFCLSAGIRRVGVNRAALMSTIGPVMTIALAYLILHEPLSLPQMLGSLLVVGGVLLVSLQKQGKSRPCKVG